MAKRKLLPIDYVTKDYEGFRQLMLEQIPVLAPDWTDTSNGDFGIVIMELLCYGLDILSFYQDKAVNESFLPTAKTRKSVINISKLLGYQLKQQRPAKFKLIFKKQAEYRERAITIPAGTRVGTDPLLGTPIAFEIDTNITIPAGALGDEKDSKGNFIYATTCTQGHTVFDDLGSGSGEPFQKFRLNNDDALLDSLKVWTEENGVVKDWTKVDDFLASTEIDRHYLAHINENNEAYLEFGDGFSGLRLKKFIPVFASYRIGGGSAGNVGAKTINSFLDEEVLGIDELYNPETAMQYGCDVEDLEHAKLLAPRLFKTNSRAVTTEDYEALSVAYAGVSKAKCIETFNEDGDVLVYVADYAYKPTSESFKKELKSYLGKKSLINGHVIVKDAEYKTFDVDVTITTYPEYANEDVKLIVENTLRKLFHIKNFDFEDDLKRAYIVKELMMMNEVLDVDIKTPTSNVVTKNTEILRLGSLSVKVEGGMN